MGYVKVQKLCRVINSTRLIFGVYDLFCPDHLLSRGTELETILTDPSILNKVQKTKEYLDFIKPPPKYKAKFWIEVIMEPNERRKSRRLFYKKKPKGSPIYGELCFGKVSDFRLMFKNEYKSLLGGVQTYYYSYSNNLDAYFRKVIVPKYIRQLERDTRGQSIPYIAVRSYISLYMSKKFGWI